MKQQAHDAVSQKQITMQSEEVTLMQAELMSTKELSDALEQSCNQETLFVKKQVRNRVQQLTNKYKKLQLRVQLQLTVS